MKILSIKESSFSCNTSEGIFFNNGRRMTPDEEKEFLRNNIAIGYLGSDLGLSSFARKQSKGLSIFNLPGERVDEKRLRLWSFLRMRNGDLKKKFEKEYRWLLGLAKRSDSDLESLTIWYLSSFDKPVAELIVNFISWYRQQ
jgi:hypothetical protein